MRQCDKSQLSNSTDWFLFCSCTQWYIKHLPIGAAAVFFSFSLDKVFLLETCWIASVWDTGFTVDWSLSTDRPPFCFGESGYV